MLKKFLVILSAGLLLQTANTVNANDASLIDKVKIQYADLAYTIYSDSLNTALILQSSIDAFVSDPNEDTQQTAKHNWKAARVPYGQSEAFRFGNPNVDDWEGQVNAWPLDEGLIDYVSSDMYEYEEGNDLGTANIIAGTDEINTDLLRDLHEKGGSEANVATGYHAIEFLLWGQDLNNDSKDQGLRSYTDFLAGDACTNANCERRAQYLKAATDLLVSDLRDIVADWSQESADNYRAQFLALNNNEALRRILFGIGSLSLGELAGERINVALLANSQEDEHSCFSDNTHVDIQENARSIRNIYIGEYTDSNGLTHAGPSLSELVNNLDPALNQALMTALDTSMEKVAVIDENARSGMFFDQQILAVNPDNNAQIREAINALKQQTVEFEKAASLLGIENLEPENSDSFSS